MKRGEMENRLLEFVTGLLPDPEPSPPVDPQTALFEEGLIDSLRILDLIAFVEEITGSRVPDAAVRLANFRTVRDIASAFGEDGAAGAPENERPPLHVFRRRAGRVGFARPFAELEAGGELTVVPPGRALLSGAPLRLLNRFDAVFSKWARDLDAEEVRYPTLLCRRTLSRAGRPVDPSASRSVVPPAVCYHVYDAREGERLETRPVFLTTRGRCFRGEDVPDPSVGRLRDFQMREIVALGTREDVKRFRTGLIAKVRGLVEALELEGRIETAEDPFFLQIPGDPAGSSAPTPRGRRLVQRMLPLKYELRLVLGEGRDCAVASFNHHLTFFGRRFEIRLPSGSPAHTGCVAFGLERWVLALLAQHGTDERFWPATLRHIESVEIEA